MNMQFDQQLDTRGLRCPLPILRCKKALAELQAGQILKTLATDPGATKDFNTFCKQTGHQMLHYEETSEQDDAGAARQLFIFFIQKKAA
jgi:tRNA 2-thiouridine synthesizing protein A